jgi:hypothetical protein
MIITNDTRLTNGDSAKKNYVYSIPTDAINNMAEMIKEFNVYDVLKP